MRELPILSTAAFLATALSPVSSWGQGTAADYDRASNLPRLTQGKVTRTGVQANWIGRTSRFWYRLDLGQGRAEFVLVDPERKTKLPAFDHARAAAALGKLQGREIAADRLPVSRIALPEDRRVALMRVDQKTYALDLETYELKEDPTDLREPQQPPRRGGGGRRPEVSPISPDQKLEMVIREHNVVLKDRQSGAETQITSDGSPEDRYLPRAYWSPDSSRVVVFRSIPAQEHKVYRVQSSPAEQLQPRLQTQEYLKPGDRIEHNRPRMFDAAAKKEIPLNDTLFATPWEINQLEWMPDSSRFMFLYNQRGHQVMRLVAVDAKTGSASAVIDEQSKTFIDWTNKVYLNRFPAQNEAVWMSERDGWCHLYLYDTSTGKVKNQITRGDWVVRGVDRIDEAKRQIWFRAGGILKGQDPYFIHYARVNFDGTGLTLLTEGDGTHTAAFCPQGKYILDTYSRVDLPPVTELRSAETGAKLMDVEKGDMSALVAAGWQIPERFAAKGRDGATDIYGVIFRPTNFDPSKKYPIIEQIYAGPQGSFVPKAFSATHGPQSMAELGFILVQIDGMGTNNRSKAFHDVCWKNLGDAGFPDRILWLKAAAAKHPSMDLTRVGIYGGSAGGQNALGGLLFHGDFYKVGVADCGCHDNRMDKVWWNEQWMGYPVGPHYAEQSNVTQAAKLKGKLLLMVGELDTNVDPASTMQVVAALIKANKDFDLLVAPNVGHGVAGTPYGRRKQRDFLVRHLLGVEPPDRNAGQ